MDDRLSQVHLTHSVPDYAKLAEAYGAVGITVDQNGAMSKALSRRPSIRVEQPCSTFASMLASSATR